MAVSDFCDNFTRFLSILWFWFCEGSNGIEGRVLPSVVAALVVLWCTWRLLKSSKSPGLPPGPRSLPLFGNLLSLEPELHRYFTKLSQTYGPIYKLRLGNKLGIVINSPSVAKEVLKDHDTTFANRDVPATARVIAYGGSDIVWNPYGPEWRMLRKVCVRELLNSSSLDTVYSLRRREVRRMVQDVYANVGSSVNIGEQMFLAVLNVITSMLWGGTIEGKEGISIGSEFREVVGEITELLGKPNRSDFYPALAQFNLHGLNKKMLKMFIHFDGIFDKIIKQRVKIDSEGNSGAKDFLQIMMQLMDDLSRNI